MPNSWLNNVQRLREERLLSKAELARRAGVSVMTIDRVEHGARCRLNTKRRIILLKEQRRRGVVGYALQSFGMKPLPSEAIVDGALMNSTAIVQAMQELMSELRVKQKEVAIGVSG